jgi:hypothetical protein
MNAAILDKLVQEAVIAGQQQVFGYGKATPQQVAFLVCEIVEIDPIVSDSIRNLLDFCYHEGEQHPHDDWDAVVDRCKSMSSYNFIRSAYSNG